MARTFAIFGILLLAFSAFAERPELIHNSIKYSDAGLQPATGRAGDISIAARALLGSDGVTDLELTTGAFDGASAPTGTLHRVQVKAGLDLEDPLTRNFDANGTFASVRLTDLALRWREPIQVQASAHSTDQQRNGVVTLTETVKRRPDLRLNLGTVPPNGIAGHPLNFYLAVAETNGDVGARADCVLRVNGEVVDRASGIWIDARSAVVCAMGYVFPAAGLYQVQLGAENVSPGDWNPANNHTNVVTVNIRDASQVVAGGSYVATATETKDEIEYFEQGDQSQPSWENNYIYSMRQSSVTRLDASFPAELDFETMQVSFSEETDGRYVRYLQSYPRLHVDNWPGPGCAELSWGRTYFFYGCVNGGATTIHFAGGGSATRYYSRWWGVFTNDWTGQSYTYDRSMNMNMGNGIPWGSTVSLQLIAADADQIWQIDPFMTLQPWSDPPLYREGCGTSWRGPVCWWRKETHSGRAGRSEM